MVLWQSRYPHRLDHVVQVDIPSVADRPIVGPGVEVFTADKFGESDFDGFCRVDGMVFLKI